MNYNNSAFGFMIGLGCGVGMALLLAPRSGAETRSQIGNKTREETDRLKLQAAQLRDSATQLAEKVRDDVARRKEGLERAVDAGIKAFQ